MIYLTYCHPNKIPLHDHNWCKPEIWGGNVAELYLANLCASGKSTVLTLTFC